MKFGQINWTVMLRGIVSQVALLSDDVTETEQKDEIYYLEPVSSLSLSVSRHYRQHAVIKIVFQMLTSRV